MSYKQKLELTWIGKEKRLKLEPRILLEDPEKSYHSKHRITEKDIFDNRLIFGDNLLALKALEQEFFGKVKCVFIDPPYNTGNYTATAGQTAHHFRETVADPSRIKQMLFGGFTRCLYPLQKFDSDTERRFAIILERDALKCVKPAKEQFQIYYKLGIEQSEYIPDFIAEADMTILWWKPKRVTISLPRKFSRKVLLLRAGANMLRIMQRLLVPSRGGICWYRTMRFRSRGG